MRLLLLALCRWFAQLLLLLPWLWFLPMWRLWWVGLRWWLLLLLLLLEVVLLQLLLNDSLVLLNDVVTLLFISEAQLVQYFDIPGRVWISALWLLLLLWVLSWSVQGLLILALLWGCLLVLLRGWKLLWDLLALLLLLLLELLLLVLPYLFFRHTRCSNQRVSRVLRYESSVHGESAIFIAVCCPAWKTRGRWLQFLTLLWVL